MPQDFSPASDHLQKKIPPSLLSGTTATGWVSFSSSLVSFHLPSMPQTLISYNLWGLFAPWLCTCCSLGPEWTSCSRNRIHLLKLGSVVRATAELTLMGWESFWMQMSYFPPFPELGPVYFRVVSSRDHEPSKVQRSVCFISACPKLVPSLENICWIDKWLNNLVSGP